MELLSGTAACLLRDSLCRAWSEKKITLKEITDRLFKAVIPDWLEAQILQMPQYKWAERCTDPIEQAMEAAIHQKIIERLINEEINTIHHQ